jgi:hypothetical protein
MVDGKYFPLKSNGQPEDQDLNQRAPHRRLMPRNDPTAKEVSFDGLEPSSHAFRPEEADCLASPIVNARQGDSESATYQAILKEMESQVPSVERLHNVT